MESYTISHNEQYNSLEITFSTKPSEAIRDALKELRFRWHGLKHCWYGYASEEAVKAALELDNEPEQETKTEPKGNKFGIKIGDLFYSSWGYEQTNVTFFQVIALVGDSSVRVREVCPRVLKREAIGPMAEDNTYEISSELLPAKSYSTFVKDQEKGDLKRLKAWSKDPKEDPCFRVDSFATAFKCKGETMTQYESWYA